MKQSTLAILLFGSIATILLYLSFHDSPALYGALAGLTIVNGIWVWGYSQECEQTEKRFLYFRDLNSPHVASARYLMSARSLIAEGANGGLTVEQCQQWLQEHPK